MFPVIYSCIYVKGEPDAVISPDVLISFGEVAQLREQIARLKTQQ